MTRKTSKLAAVLSSVAAFSLMASPALAGPGWGWGGHHHRDRVDAGDVLTGILILGGIAAIASAASKPKDRRYERRSDDRRYEEPRYENGRYDDRPEWREGTGINAAISRCLGEVSRDGSGEAEVDSVNRDGDGWRVAGRSDGATFSCQIDGDGRIRNVDVDRAVI